MSEARISHEDLEQFAARLAEMRDERIPKQKDNPLAEYYAGEVQAFRLALACLHTWSDGAYGEPYPFDEQGAPTRAATQLRIAVDGDGGLWDELPNGRFKFRREDGDGGEMKLDHIEQAFGLKEVRDGSIRPTEGEGDK